MGEECGRSGGVRVREIGEEDFERVAAWLETEWGGRMIETCGRFVDAALLPGFVAERGGEAAGFLTYEIERGECEVVTLLAFERGRGVGTALLSAAVAQARAAGCRRIWLATTNDNLAALGFYQKRGFRIVRIHRDSITAARQIKPQIPLVGESGIAMCDEVELEMRLAPE